MKVLAVMKNVQSRDYTGMKVLVVAEKECLPLVWKGSFCQLVPAALEQADLGLTAYMIASASTNSHLGIL